MSSPPRRRNAALVRQHRDGSREQPWGSSLPRGTFTGLAAATLATLLIAFLSYRSLAGGAQGARSISQSFDVIQRLDALLSSLKDAEAGQRGFLLTGVDDYLEPYSAAVAALPDQLAQTRQAFGNGPDQGSRLAVLEQLVARHLAELAESIELKRSGRMTAGKELSHANRSQASMDQIRSMTTEMREEQRRLLETRTREWEDGVAVAAIVTWGGSGLLLFLIAAAATLSAREFREQRIQDWLNTAQTELASRMQGEQDIAGLANSILGFLATYLDALVGALYFVDGPHRFQRIASYALPPDTANTEPGGLTRQVLEQNAPLYVQDVPEGYFPVNSGLGSRVPRHLLLAPAEVDGVANAVLELGFFHAVPPAALDLAKRVAGPLGMALRSARYRRELQHLLEETQRQAEELQAQQEELRVQNEELDQQTRALQESQARLQNQQSELEQINAQLEEQTQALEQQRDNLTLAQEELQRANAYKSEFLANMSHELRTPLNSALILARLLGENRDGNLSTEQVKFAQTIYAAGIDLLTLINDILDLSRIEAGKLDVQPENVTLQRLADELLDAFHPLAREKGLELAIAQQEDAPVSLYTDPTRLQQILKNLLSNAVKFTESGGISLMIRRVRDGRIAFEVKDTGIGIAPEQQAAIFEAFRQADGTTHRKYGGTGLGLSISRELSRLLGGELTLESVPGRGSTFTLFLPASAPHQRPRELPGNLRSPPAAMGPSAPELPLVERPDAAPASAPDDRERLAPGARSVLIIEDDQAFAREVYELAHELEFQALIADRAEEGLALAERYQPSAIVLDVGLPDRSGLSVLDALKHRPSTRHIPVHVVSGFDYAQAALEMGAAGYAIKPVRREELRSALEHLQCKFTQKLRRVLVVEDDDMHRDAIGSLLSADNVDTLAVASTAEALEQLRSSSFDCLVLDLMLPDRSGFELLEEMSQGEQYCFPPVIVYTGRSLSRQEEQELRRFSNSIIIKGARSPERLLDEVTLFLHQVESSLPPDRQRMLRDARHREAVFEGRRVLVVEDDVRNIFALSSVLEPRGAKVEIARNGREALSHLEQNPGVDLVLMDIMMGEMDGLEATRQIRKQPQLAKLPIIALTAKAMADDRQQCLAAGANDYLAKPFDVDKLLSLARVWMTK